MGNISKAWAWAVEKCNDPNVAYSQQYRNEQTVDGITYYDCSSFINYALNAGGYKTPSYAPSHNAFTTSTEPAELERLGFTRMSAYVDWLPGDILWRKGHTEMAYSATKSMGAHSSSGAIADQVSIVDSNPSKWTWLYRDVRSTEDGMKCKMTGGFEETSAEAEWNATLIYYYLTQKGWTVNAICGLLGNIGHESGYNPWRWQGDKVPSKDEWSGLQRGYGLVQFTPPSKYIGNSTAMLFEGYGPNFSDSSGTEWDGYAQLQFVNDNVDGGYIKTDDYPYTFKQFKESTVAAGTLARAWMHNYERPASYSTEDVRAASAEYWYGILSGVSIGHSVVVDYSGGNGWIYDIKASPFRYVPEGTEVKINIEMYDSFGLPEPEFIYWRVNYGNVTVNLDGTFTMGPENVSITAMFTGKTLDPFAPYVYTRRRKLWLKPWYIQNRGE